MDGEKYIPLIFRVDGSGTQRRYWHWMLCGSDSDAKLGLQTGGDREAPLRYNLNAFFYSNSTGSTDDAAPDTSVPGRGFPMV